MHPDLSPWLVDTLQGLPCRILLPEGYVPTTRYPLVVSLHGSGERGTDNVAQLKNGLAVFATPAFRRRHRCIVVAPQAPRGVTFGGSWYGGRTTTQDSVVALVRELRERRTVDPARVYGVGFSMGAIGLLDLAARNPDLLAGLVAIAGDLDDASVHGLRGQPLWAVVGGRDEIVPPGPMRDAVAALQKAGSPAQLTEVQHDGHDVWRGAFEHGPLWDWLFAQRRSDVVTPS